MKELGFGTEGDALEKELRTQLITTAVDVNETNTVRHLKSNGTEIPSHLHDSAVRTAVIYGGSEEWNFLLEKMKTETDARISCNYIKVLALTTDAEILQQYLDLSLDSSIVGGKVCFGFGLDMWL